VPFLRTFHHDDGADHLGGCSDVEVQRSPSRGGVKISTWASVAMSLSSASWASTAQEKRSCFFKSR
jgi:hypothetical protein